jgi:hypothetical protein
VSVVERTHEHDAVLRKTLEHVLAHPAGYDQSTWGRRDVDGACGTTHCVAGHVAVTVVGATPVWSGRSIEGVIDPATGRRVDVPWFAAARVGLDVGRASRLFYGGASLRRVVELAYLYTDGRVDLLDAVPPPTTLDLAREAADAATAYAAWRWDLRADAPVRRAARHPSLGGRA